MKKLALSITVTTLLFSAGSAMAAEGGEKEFGDQGTLAFGAATGLNFSYTSISPPQGDSTSVIQFSVLPQIQYFVIDGLSVGGELEFAITKPKDSDTLTTFGIGPTVGYNVWLSPGLLSLWPQLEFRYRTEGTTGTTTVGTTTTTISGSRNTITLGAFVPLLIHPVKHFHFGVGPYFDVDLSAKESFNGNSADAAKELTFGIRGEIGGWL